MPIRFTTANLATSPNPDTGDVVVFRDIDAQFKLSQSFDDFTSTVQDKNDIIASENIDAIRNSIINLLTIQPGERKLSYSYGLNLADFLGMPLTDSTAQLIGDTIYEAIKNNERRITVNRLLISPNIDQNAYRILIMMSVPSIGQQFSIQGNLLVEEGIWDFTV
jgi:phage baseplate assembly protein W